MESYALYLLRSVAWLTGFALVFILFLKNERFFLLNRIYLITGIVVALIFPFITVHYVVNIPLINSSGTTAGDVNSLNNQGNNFTYDFLTALFIIYITGAVLLFLRVLKHNNSVLKIIKNTGINKTGPVKLIRTADYKSSFSFFSYVIVNPSVSDDETREIMNHEIVHIKQMHWIDLVLVEVLCLVQWFNPLVWIYMRLIRQNHEYLADEVALQRSTDPAIYKATLLNQIVGSEVVSLTNSFSYSLSKKRFNMMKKIISSPYRKLKFFLILPVFAIVLYAFATPEYRYTVYDNSGGNTDQVSTQKGNDDQVALIPEAGRKIEMVTDIQDDTVRKSGKRAETLLPPPPPPPPPASEGVNSDTPPPPPPSVSSATADGATPLYVVDGILISKEDAGKIDPNTIESVNILKNESRTEKYGEKGKDGVVEITTKKKAIETGNTMAPPPPPQSVVKIAGDGPPPLYVVDGVKVPQAEVEALNPDAIESISVLKNKSSVDYYGAKENSGVIFITTKKVASQKEEKDGFVVVEEMPKFPGGHDAMVAWINANLKYPSEAVKAKITGKVLVNFEVSSKGNVKNVQVIKSINPLLDAEAVRLIKSMPDWKPGMQSGKPVSVQFTVPVEFKLQ